MTRLGPPATVPAVIGGTNGWHQIVLGASHYCSKLYFTPLAITGLLSEAAQVARGRLRCLGPGEILRGLLRFS